MQYLGTSTKSSLGRMQNCSLLKRKNSRKKIKLSITTFIENGLDINIFYKIIAIFEIFINIFLIPITHIENGLG